MSAQDKIKRMAGHPFAGIAAAGVVLCAILGYLVVDRLLLLSRGREVVLTIRPVDPRDLFKGDFVRLNFDISALPEGIVPEGTAAAWRERVKSKGLSLYVILEKGTDDSWQPVSVSDQLPGGLGPNRVAIKGRALAYDVRRVRYGIERYFVPEGTGGRIEQLARDAKLAAIVAVDGSGRAAIKGLMVAGKRVYDEPLL